MLYSRYLTLKYSTPNFGAQTQHYFQGYLVERKKVKANRWIRLNGDLATYHHYLVKRLVDGNTYQVNSSDWLALKYILIGPFDSS